jgi:leucyl aminopeptidase
MEFITKVASPEAVKTDALAVGIYSDGSLSAAARSVDTASGGALKAAVKSGDATGKRGNVVVLRHLKGVSAPRVVLTGLGAPDELTDRTYCDAVKAALKNAGGGVRQIALAAGDWAVKGRDIAWQARMLAVAARETAFRTDELKSKKDENGARLAQVALLLKTRNASAERALAQGVALANGMELTKRLGNLPGNVCTPTFLGEQAKKLGKEFGLSVEVNDRKAIEKLGMGSFLSVTNGSVQPPRLIVIKYQGAAKTAAPTVLVGKGITFDSGGISLKPGPWTK